MCEGPLCVCLGMCQLSRIWACHSVSCEGNEETSLRSIVQRKQNNKKQVAGRHLQCDPTNNNNNKNEPENTTTEQDSHTYRYRYMFADI